MADDKSTYPAAVAPQAVATEVPTDTERPDLYQWLVWVLGTLALVSLIGIIWLALLGKPVDAGLSALGGIAVGALASPLAPRQK